MLSRIRAGDSVTRGQRAASSVGLGLHPLQIFVRVERGHASGAGRGDGLAIDMIGHIAGGEYAGDAGARSLRLRCRP